MTRSDRCLKPEELGDLAAGLPALALLAQPLLAEDHGPSTRLDLETLTGPVIAERVLEGIEEPVGVWVIGDTIYTSGGWYIMGHLDNNGDGVADAADTVFTWEDHGYERRCRHERSLVSRQIRCQRF